MARLVLEAVHNHYGSQLDIMESLNSPRAACCPVTCSIKNQTILCRCAIGLPKSLLIMALLKDLHFHKSQMHHGADPHYPLVCISRVARLIAENTFCAKHEPHSHAAEFKRRFDSIHDRALQCPLFPTLGEDPDFQQHGAGMLPSVAPQNHTMAKRAREEEDDDGGFDVPPPPPASKRARPMLDNAALQCTDPVPSSAFGLPSTFNAAEAPPAWDPWAAFTSQQVEDAIEELLREQAAEVPSPPGQKTLGVTAARESELYVEQWLEQTAQQGFVFGEAGDDGMGWWAGQADQTSQPSASDGSSNSANGPTQ